MVNGPLKALHSRLHSPFDTQLNTALFADREGVNHSHTGQGWVQYVAGDRTTNLPVSQRPALPPEPQLPMEAKKSRSLKCSLESSKGTQGDTYSTLRHLRALTCSAVLCSQDREEGTTTDAQ